MPRPPSTGGVTSPYGPRVAPLPGASTNHLGEDTVGDGNYWPVSGVVIFAGYYGSWGNIIGIRQGSDESVIWWVAHNASIPANIKFGTWGNEGDYLAPLGATGNVTGPHAHTERRVGGSYTPGTGTPTNPRDYYTAGAGIGGGTIIGDDMPLSEDDIYRIWTFQLGQASPPAGQKPIVGRAADWLTNMSDAVGRVLGRVSSPAPVALTDAQVKTLAESIAARMPAVNFKPVLDAIAAGEAQDAADRAAILAAIDKVDEATLATFGLKRL